jgi:hypothetical protein
VLSYSCYTIDYIWESKKKNLNVSITKKTLEFLQKLKDSGHWNDDNDYSEVDSLNKRNKLKIKKNEKI